MSTAASGTTMGLVEQGRCVLPSVRPLLPALPVGMQPPAARSRWPGPQSCPRGPREPLLPPWSQPGRAHLRQGGGPHLSPHFQEWLARWSLGSGGLETPVQSDPSLIAIEPAAGDSAGDPGPWTRASEAGVPLWGSRGLWPVPASQAGLPKWKLGRGGFCTLRVLEGLPSGSMQRTFSPGPKSEGGGSCADP